MIDPRPTSFSTLVSAAREPTIVLTALSRLRWLAVVGQIAATGVAVGALHLRLPFVPIISVVLSTAISNILLIWLGRYPRASSILVRCTLLLDVLLLTALLYLTGGPGNPFSSLYLVHVAIAVIVCGAVWTWSIVATAAACYGLLLHWHLPLHEEVPLSSRTLAIGSWIALVLVAVLITVFIGRVIRALRQREFELVGARERAAKNEQLAALTTLAAGAAHELNTPLGTIAVAAKELELSCGSSGALASVLEDARLIRREVDRCRTILNRLRLDIKDASPRSITLISELLPSLSEHFDEGELDRLKIDRDATIATVLAPPQALQQALLVMLRNAFDASPVDRPVALSIQRVDGAVRFQVRDCGSGMPPDVLRRAGEPFFTTKAPGRGMGLGLFLVHLVAERCGATFAVDSTEGEGTRCVLEIPGGTE